MTQTPHDSVEPQKQHIFLTSDEDREKALAKAAEEANFPKDLVTQVLNAAITFGMLLLLYWLYEQGFLSDFGILGLIIVLVVALILILRAIRSVRGVLFVLTYKKVANRTQKPYVRTPYRCSFLQHLPFRFICAPRPLTDFPDDLLFRCHVKTEWEACQKEIVPELIDYLKENENPVVRTRAAWGLGIIGSNEATPVLIDGLKDSNANVKFICTWSLGNIGAETAVDPLIELFDEEEPRLRAQASESLISIGKAACLRLIQEGQAKADDSEHLSLVIATLGKIGCDEALPFLIGKLSDEDDLIQLQAAYALGDTKHEEAVAPLLQSMTSEDTFLREAALDSLTKLGYLTLLGLVAYLDVGGNESIAHEIIYRMEDDLKKEIEKLREMGKNEEIEKLEQLLNLSTPLIASNE
ncbi:MAG: HEAT repeat domain-containing protein [Candidatus Hodarchaeota archaeon]